MTETVAPQTGTPTQDVPTFDLYIAGEWVPSESGRTFESRNPADRRVERVSEHHGLPILEVGVPDLTGHLADKAGDHG